MWSVCCLCVYWRQTDWRKKEKVRISKITIPSTDFAHRGAKSGHKSRFTSDEKTHFCFLFRSGTLWGLIQHVQSWWSVTQPNIHICHYMWKKYRGLNIWGMFLGIFWLVVCWEWMYLCLYSLSVFYIMAILYWNSILSVCVVFVGYSNLFWAISIQNFCII